MDKFQLNKIFLKEYKNLTVLIDGKTGLLYHGSPKQNLKIIDPLKIDKKRVVGDRDYNKIYGTWNIKFASMFCQIGSFRGSNKDGWTIVTKQLPTNYNKPCSIYILKSTWFKPTGKNMGPELYSNEAAKVVKEIKFRSVKECWKELGVELVITDNVKEY